MKKKIALSVCLLLAAALAGGCSTPHLMVMKDGRTVETRDRPEYDPQTGFYTYTDKDGNDVKVNKNEVVEFKEKP